MAGETSWHRGLSCGQVPKGVLKCLNPKPVLPFPASQPLSRSGYSILITKTQPILMGEVLLSLLEAQHVAKLGGVFQAGGHEGHIPGTKMPSHF